VSDVDRKNIDVEAVKTKALLDKGLIETSSGDFLKVSSDAADTIKEDIDNGLSFSSNNSDGPDCCPE